MPQSNTPKKMLPYMPWQPPKPIVVATQAVAAGVASPEQQQLFMKWVVNDLCKTYDLTYYPDSRRDSDFADGKAFVGQQLVRQIKLKVGLIKDKKE